MNNKTLVLGYHLNSELKGFGPKSLRLMINYLSYKYFYTAKLKSASHY